MSKYFLGIDIGTYETKGVIVSKTGEIISQAAKKHEMIVPQSGWAEHRPIEDWWNDFVFICKDIISKSKCNPKEIYKTVDRFLTDKGTTKEQIEKSQSIINKFKTGNSTQIASKILFDHL